MISEEQRSAINIIIAHCRGTKEDSPAYLTFKGPAGVGKTSCLKVLAAELTLRIAFTAPTNKATKVLREMLTEEDYKPNCCTIYSLLGLKMEANGEIKELSQLDEDLYLSSVAVVVVDEASMVNKLLKQYIDKASALHPNIRWVFVGDAWQLPPVGEDLSPVWELESVELTKVMRHDNQILAFASRVRRNIETPFRSLEIKSDFAEGEGVWALNEFDFEKRIIDPASISSLIAGKSKVIAWRNLRVDHFNKVIRREFFAEAERFPWQPGDRLTLTGPAIDLIEDDFGRHRPLGSTDDEGVVEKADLAVHPEHGDFECWGIRARMDDNRMATFWSLCAHEAGKFDKRLQRLAGEARDNKRLWYLYWGFREQFHAVRHAYAITAHRAQGSTYENAFVNWRDILKNPNRSEAYRCLYVAASRPKRQLILG